MKEKTTLNKEQVTERLINDARFTPEQAADIVEKHFASNDTFIVEHANIVRVGDVLEVRITNYPDEITTKLLTVTEIRKRAIVFGNYFYAIHDSKPTQIHEVWDGWALRSLYRQ